MPRLARSDWERHKPLIQELYVHQDKSLEATLGYLKANTSLFEEATYVTLCING